MRKLKIYIYLLLVVICVISIKEINAAKEELKKTVIFTTTPAGADVYMKLDDTYYSIGKTPLKSYRTQVKADLIIFKPGYAEQRLILNTKNKLKFNFRLKKEINKHWKSAGGPPGCDATAFYLDKKGTYWLGTGSSGGIYCSSDHGKSWQVRNRGITPVHIVRIGQVEGSMYCEVYARRFNYHHARPYHQSSVIFKYNPKNRYWSAVADFKQKEIIFQNLVKQTILNDTLFKNYLLKKSWLDGLTYNLTDMQAPGWVQNHFGHSILEIKTSGGIKLGNFPQDCFRLPAGNLFYNEKKEILLLSRSGVYKLRNNTFSQQERRGLIATDVRQIINGRDNSYWVRANESDIWRYKNNSWNLVYDGYKQGVLSGNKFDYPGEFDTRDMNLHPDGRLLFVANGEIKEVAVSGKISMLYKKGKMDLQDNGITNTDFFHLSAARDSSGVIWSTGRMASGNRLISVVVKYDTQSKIPVVVKKYDQTYSSHAFVLCDKKGKIWLVDNSSMKQIGAGADPIAKYTREQKGWLSGRESQINEVAIGKQGELAFIISKNKILKWHPKRKWEIIKTDNLEGIMALGFDGNGNLYAGTGFIHTAGCGIFADGVAHGLFRLENKRWIKVQGELNGWIMSIAPHHQSGLVVGTSGSGMFFVKTK